jgi:hypothetical protein
MEYARRFRALLADLGLSYPDAAQFLHVSLRTLHNWTAGKHPVPYSATKMLRLMRHMELPGASWQGWHFSRGCLVTPEGRVIHGHESSWWSLLIQRARSFGVLYEQQKGLAAAQPVPYSEPCNSNSQPAATPALSDIPHGNHGDNLPITGPKWGHSDTITEPWPLISDSLLKSIPLPVATASGSESPLIRLSALHLTPIYNGPKLPYSLPLPRYSLSLNPLPQPLPQALQAPPRSHGKNQLSRLPLGLLPSQSPSSRANRAKLSAPSWPTGTADTWASSQAQGGVL